MQLVAGWANEYRRKSIDYFDESGARGATELAAMIGKIHGARDGRKHYRLGKWGSGSGKPDKRDPNKPIAIQFQAADFLAYETYRHIGNHVVNGIKVNKRGEEIPLRMAHRELIGGPRAAKGKPPYYILYFDKELIGIFLDNLNKLEAKLRTEK